MTGEKDREITWGKRHAPGEKSGESERHTHLQTERERHTWMMGERCSKSGKKQNLTRERDFEKPCT